MGRRKRTGNFLDDCILFTCPNNWLELQALIPLTGKVTVVNDNIETDKAGTEWRYLDTKDILSHEARADLRKEKWELIIVNVRLDDGNWRHGMSRKMTPAIGV